MATLLELKTLFTDSDLQDRVEVSLLIAVQTILDGAPVLDDQKYAAHVFSNPVAEAKKALMYLLAANSSATLTQIKNGTDAQINTKVAAVVSALSAAYNVEVV